MWRKICLVWLTGLLLGALACTTDEDTSLTENDNNDNTDIVEMEAEPPQ